MERAGGLQGPGTGLLGQSGMLETVLFVSAQVQKCSAQSLLYLGLMLSHGLLGKLFLGAPLLSGRTFP